MYIHCDKPYKEFRPIFFYDEEYDNILLKVRKMVNRSDSSFCLRKEKELYGGMSDQEKVFYEISRLMAFDYNGDEYIRERVKYELYIVRYNVNMRCNSKTDYYDDFLRMLVMLEIFAGMDVQLFSTLEEIYDINSLGNKKSR